MDHINFFSSPASKEDFSDIERRARQDMMEFYSQLNQEEIQAWLYGDFNKKGTELTEIAAAVKSKFNRANDGLDSLFADVMFPKLNEFKGSVTSDTSSMFDIKVDVNTILASLDELKMNQSKPPEPVPVVISNLHWESMNIDRQSYLINNYNVQIVDKIGGIVDGGTI